MAPLSQFPEPRTTVPVSNSGDRDNMPRADCLKQQTLAISPESRSNQDTLEERPGRRTFPYRRQDFLEAVKDRCLLLGESRRSMEMGLVFFCCCCSQFRDPIIHRDKNNAQTPASHCPQRSMPVGLKTSLRAINPQIVPKGVRRGEPHDLRVGRNSLSKTQTVQTVKRKELIA